MNRMPINQDEAINIARRLAAEKGYTDLPGDPEVQCRGDEYTVIFNPQMRGGNQIVRLALSDGEIRSFHATPL